MVFHKDVGFSGEVHGELCGETQLKVSIITYGSRGDVQPLLALALSLSAAGHEVILATPPEHADWVESCGCSFRPLGSNVQAFLQKCPDPHTFKAALAFGRFLRQELKSQFVQLPVIIEGTDLVLGAALILGVPSVAESLGVPYRFIAFCPQVLPSRQHPSVLVRNYNLPHWLNRLSWWFTNTIDILNFKAVINRERSRLGLRPVRDIWRHFLGSQVIVASDEVLAPVPRDVEQDYVQTGYFHLQQTGELSADLEAFLASGPPPVYVGFGSMPSEHPEATMRLVLEAVRSAGQRAILSPGWSEVGQMTTERDCKLVGDVPHTILFPRVAAVVHHGGSGTTATAARTGVPQIIVPHILDQYYWASRIHRVGLGPRPIRRSRLTTDRLSAAIREAASNEALHRRVPQVAGILQGHDSLREALRVIESGISSNSRSFPG